MESNEYIYNVNYNIQDHNLCAFEVKALFNHELEDKVFFTDKEVDPSISPFIKNRIRVIYKKKTLDEILDTILEDDFRANDFMVKYVGMYNRDPNIDRGKKLSKEIGLRIYGYPSFESAKVLIAITEYQGHWYFGYLKENNYEWREHKQKPYSFSSALGVNMAKVLINVATKGDTSKSIIDTCCGVGTVVLAGKFAGHNICGWEINPKISKLARMNLEHYEYNAEIITGDMRDIEKRYDVVVVDLPYNNFSLFDEKAQFDIIRHAKNISNRMVIVSSVDMREKLNEEGLEIIDFCKAGKTIKRDFARYIWICEK